MTEEIIIDGCNVAECNFYTKGISDFCVEKDWYCADIKDCYYKQLQRLKAENEELKRENEILIEKAYRNADRIYLEEKENNKLYEALEEIRDYIKGHKIADEARLKGIENIINEVL